MTDSRRNIEDAFVRREPFFVAAVVALAAVLRLPDLFGWWLNPDEGIYYGVVTRDGFGAAWAEALTTAHPPLYFVVLRAVGLLSTDFVALRAVALVSACAAVYVFILVGREIGGEGVRGRVVGLAAGLLLAVSPRAVVLSQVVRPYMLLLLLLAASLLLLLRYLRAPSTRRLLAHVACSLLAALLHYASVFGLAVVGIVVLADGVQRGLGRTAWRRLLAVQAVPAAALAMLYLTHLRGIAAGPLGDHALDGWLAPYMIGEPLDAWLGFVGFHSMLAGDAWAAPAALLTVGAAAFALRSRGPDPLVVTVVAGYGIGIAGAALQLYPFGPTRHTAWLLVFQVPLLAWALGWLLTSGRAVALKAVPLLVLTLLGGRLLAPVLDPEERPREISEHVLRQEAVDAMAEVLDPRVDPPVILMSTETYEQLTPLYADARQSAQRSADGRFLWFRWGERDVIVLPSRDFVTRPDQLGLANHLYTGALVAEAESGIELPRGGEPVLVLSGGWRSQGIVDLVELARRVGPLGTTTSVPGLIALYLDLDAYGRALGVPGI